MKKLKTETPRHVQAFEYYFGLGDENRSFKKVAEYFKVALSTIQQWNESFNWQRRIEIKNNEIKKEIQKQAKQENLKQTAKLLTDIDATLALMRQLLSKNMSDVNAKELIFDQMKNAKDYDAFMRALERAIVNRRKLTGDATEAELAADDQIIRIYLPQKRNRQDNE